MITANKARELYNEDESYKNTLEYLNDIIQSAAKDGRVSVHTYVHTHSVKDRLVKELIDLGYSVTVENFRIDVSF